MNHLAHLALARSSPDLMVGSFMGDFVKGRLSGNYPVGFEKGIRLHRAIDAYTDRHRLVMDAGKRFAKPYRRYAGIMLDIIFDHFLACHWGKWYPDSLEKFSTTAMLILLKHNRILPERALVMAQSMQRYNTLHAYTDEAFIGTAFERVGMRLKRVNPLHCAYEEFLTHRETLQSDFHQFYPDLMRFTNRWLGMN